MKVSPGCISAMKAAWLACAAGVRLHVGEAALEQLLGALDRQRLGLVDELAAAVVAVARIALGVLVGQHAARASSTARETMFSEAISSISSCWRSQLAVDDARYLGVAFGQGLRKRSADLAPVGALRQWTSFSRIGDAPVRRGPSLSWGLARQQGGTHPKPRERTANHLAKNWRYRCCLKWTGQRPSRSVRCAVR